MVVQVVPSCNDMVGDAVGGSATSGVQDIDQGTAPDDAYVKVHIPHAS